MEPEMGQISHDDLILLNSILIDLEPKKIDKEWTWIQEEHEIPVFSVDFDNIPGRVWSSKGPRSLR